MLHLMGLLRIRNILIRMQICMTTQLWDDGNAFAEDRPDLSIGQHVEHQGVHGNPAAGQLFLQRMPRSGDHALDSVKKLQGWDDARRVEESNTFRKTTIRSRGKGNVKSAFAHHLSKSHQEC
ncbi:unnamed protein product [Amoebophrya sp. A120]|nr:unnamed protein product [Amoebophrya sp. A120]|eukprot:GSA120T00001959001.1